MQNRVIRTIERLLESEVYLDLIIKFGEKEAQEIFFDRPKMNYYKRQYLTEMKNEVEL